MLRVERGEKHLCLSCATRFYDLGREAARCPKCGEVFVRPPPPPARPVRVPRSFVVVKAAAPVEPEAVIAEDEEEEEASEAESEDELLIDETDENEGVDSIAGKSEEV
jgi:uncharacterized protein (TIGR02300 family)